MMMIWKFESQIVMMNPIKDTESKEEEEEEEEEEREREREKKNMI